MKHVSELRFYVKIEAGPRPGGNPSIYYNNGFTFENFNKWKWFFDYRAALYKVQHPRHWVHVWTGSYDYTPPEEEAKIILNNKILGKKRTITKFKNLVRLAKENWNQLFPIEEDPYYKKAVAKIERLENELIELCDQEKIIT